ncbi:MAG: EAL domain-containing protein [Treponema sp.]|nr:EAL domain-containing protein [Treponema sp.]
MKFIYHYDIAALLISIVILCNVFFKQRIKTRVSKSFKILAIDLFLSIIFDILTIFSITYYTYFPVWLNYILNIICLLTYNLLPVFYISSIVCATTEEDDPILRKSKIIISVPTIIAILMIITTPLTKGVIYFDEKGVYHANWMIDVLAGIGFVYLIMVIVQGIKKRKSIRFEQTVTILVYTLSNIIALIIVNIWTNALITLLFASIAVLVTYLSLDNPSEYKDPIMDIYNKKAFLITTAAKFTGNKNFVILGVQLEGITYLNETLGYNNFNRMLALLAKRLCGICGRNNLFRISGSKIAILINSEDKDIDDKLLELQLLFSSTTKFRGVEFTPKVKMALFHCPLAADNAVKLNDLIFDTLNSPETTTGTIIDGDKKMTEKAHREHALSELLKQALSQNQFEVFYQPIYSIKDKRFTTAEALVRLTNMELGFVSPDEFIPVAEKNGLIHMIGEFVFRSVCKFIINNKLWEKGIEYIHVNLSVIQCMQEKLYEQLLGIMDFYGLDYKYIELEVTETAAVVSSDTLMINMKQLMEKNMSFALDDYGMGYSNTTSILKYPFHTIKLDKSIVWAAMKDDKARKLLQHTIAMFRDMGIELVAEGVETKEMAAMLSKMKCDYLQGYFYSKPVKAEEFLKLLQD